MYISLSIYFLTLINILQDEKELCLATAQFEDFVLQFMDR